MTFIIQVFCLVVAIAAAFGVDVAANFLVIVAGFAAFVILVLFSGESYIDRHNRHIREMRKKRPDFDPD